MWPFVRIEKFPTWFSFTPESHKMKLILPLMGHPVQMVNTEWRREREKGPNAFDFFCTHENSGQPSIAKGGGYQPSLFSDSREIFSREMNLNFYYMQGPFFNREVGTEWQQEIDNIKQQEIIKPSISRLLEIFNWPFLKRGRKFPWNSFVNVACWPNQALA